MAKVIAYGRRVGPGSAPIQQRFTVIYSEGVGIMIM